jgi:hypothetical protein
LLLAATFAACSGSAPHDATRTPPATVATAPSATPRAQPTPLAAQIGVRGTLPPNDPSDIAVRYGKTAGRVAATKPFAGEPAVGSQRDFFVTHITASALSGKTPPETVTITATLLAKTAHAYFYEDVALQADPAAVQQAADLFESSVWPTITAVFGEPASPGIDGDPRIIVLQADLGGAAGGYFSGDDVYLRALRPYSNEAEMVYMDRTLRPGGATFNVVLAHEFQHLIHDRNDPDEESWVNEGLSEDASGLVGGALSSVKSFESRPETQLNNWEQGGQAHYGAGASFFRYLASRFGGDPSLGAIARQLGDGQQGIDAFLQSIGQALRFRDVFADWIAANILNREAGPYGNPGHPLTMHVPNDLALGAEPVDGNAPQFGADYYNLSGLDAANDYILHFEGQARVPVLPTAPLPGATSMLWGNAQDDVDTTLTREVDLTGRTAPALTFRTWFDIESYYDWGYVSVSTDGGATWTALPGSRTIAADPVRVALGPGYTGKSGGGDAPSWLDERIDLSAYAGTKILLRFEYITDGGTHGPGWAVADVRITAAGGDLPDASWQLSGWVDIDRELPQTYIVRVLEKKTGGDVAVLDVPLDDAQRGDLRFSAAGVESATLVVAGSTEGTDQLAPYTVSLRTP